MNTTVRTLLSLVFLAILTECVYAQHVARPRVDGTQTLASLWREAALPENRTSPHEVLRMYERLIDTTRSLRSWHKHWYQAVTHFGIARAAAWIDDTLKVRAALLDAIDKGFWNFDIMFADPKLRSIGGPWLDSVASHYEARRARERSTWNRQSLITIRPYRANRGTTFWNDSTTASGSTRTTFDRQRFFAVGDSIMAVRWQQLRDTVRASEHKPPVIIALHGGNASYFEFSSHWWRIARETGAYVLVPPGLTRYSQTMNGWEEDLASLERYVSGFIDSLRDADGNLPPIYLAGYSQGARAAIEIALRRPEAVRGVFAISGFIDAATPSSLLEMASQHDLKIYAISGEYDSPNFKATLDICRQRCEAFGIPFVLDIIPGMVHEVPAKLEDYFAHAWDWFQEQGIGNRE